MSGLTVTGMPISVTLEAEALQQQTLCEQVTIEILEDGITTEFRSETIDVSIEADAFGPVLISPEISIITVAEQGPPGVDGAEGGSRLGFFECGEPITSSSLIHLSPIDGRLYLADNVELRPASGFTTAGADEGDTIEVSRIGMLTGLGGLSAGQPRWLGEAGQTRSTIPAVGVVQLIGAAVSATVIYVDIQEPTEIES